MKHFMVFIVCFLAITNILYSQNQQVIKLEQCKGVEINFNGVLIEEAKFLRVLNSFDFEKYRPKYIDYIMKFNNGIEIKLNSFDFLKKNGCNLIEKEVFLTPEFLNINIKYFQYNEQQGTIMASYYTNKQIKQK